jgi:hypothetical protein
MGHDSERAAMIYLHGSDARQQQIADTLSKLTRDELRRGASGESGQPGRKRSGARPEASLLKINCQGRRHAL